MKTPGPRCWDHRQRGWATLMLIAQHVLDKRSRTRRPPDTDTAYLCEPGQCEARDDLITLISTIQSIMINKNMMNWLSTPCGVRRRTTPTR